MISGALAAAGIAVGGCSPQSETPIPKRVTASATTEGGPLKIKPLWSESGFREQAFDEIYQELKDGKYVAKSNVDAGRFIFLKDPNKKPFYDTSALLQFQHRPAGIEPVCGEVVTFYREHQDPHHLWPLAQEYKTLGFLNVFLIGGYGNFPQEARTLKVGAEDQVSAEANVTRVLVDGNRQFTGVEIEEVHYGSSGEPTFHCISQFNKDFVKVGETDIVGRKLEEYYFLWPTATN